MNNSESFKDAMRAKGITPPDHLIQDGEIHRFKSHGDNQENGWYSYRSEPENGTFGHFRLYGDQKFEWKPEKIRQLTDEEGEKLKRQMAADRAKKYREDKKKREEAKKMAGKVWEASTPAPADHAYLGLKRIKPYGARLYQGGIRGVEKFEGNLVVPVTNEGELVGLQFISPTGEKRFLFGTPVQGSWTLIGDQPKEGQPIVVCEGFATGASIFEATGIVTAVAYNCGNLKSVAETIRIGFPTSKIIICGDNDQFTDGNPGERKAKSAAAAVVADLRIPTFPPNAEGKPTDFNDLFQIGGAEEVRRQIMEGTPSAEITELVDAHLAEIVSPKETPQFAINLTSEAPPSRLVRERSAAIGLKVNNFGNPICNLDNLIRVLTVYEPFKKMVWLDNFHHKVFTEFGGQGRREWSEADSLKLLVIIQREFGMDKLTLTHITQAVVIVSNMDQRWEVRDWIDSLTWDGKPRIEAFLSECLGVQESEYTKAVSRNFWVAIAARLYQPGCKFDNMVILEGKQGLMKSTALQAIAGNGLYASAGGDPGKKDFCLDMEGKLIIEIEEMANFDRAEVNIIKKILSSSTDRFRPPYGRKSEDFPRQSVFVGTTNDTEYLRDSTGGRRFWPVRVTRVDIDLIKEHREQFFAEAKARFQQGWTWWEVPITDAEIEQELRRQRDPWEELIESFCAGRESVSTQEICKDLGVDTAHVNHGHAIRIAKILKTLGYERRTSRFGDGSVATSKRYFRKTLLNN